ncbi:Uncharacterised protein [Mycobacteroides abscessus subsp. abscessus]|nr:Uncharacterised protein [Mycobacteroides abscessus subsp. abscessus]
MLADAPFLYVFGASDFSCFIAVDEDFFDFRSCEVNNAAVGGRFDDNLCFLQAFPFKGGIFLDCDAFFDFRGGIHHHQCIFFVDSKFFRFVANQVVDFIVFRFFRLFWFFHFCRLK